MTGRDAKPVVRARYDICKEKRNDKESGYIRYSSLRLFNSMVWTSVLFLGCDGLMVWTSRLGCEAAYLPMHMCIRACVEQ
jgi:hypothetical protein